VIVLSRAAPHTSSPQKGVSSLSSIRSSRASFEDIFRFSPVFFFREKILCSAPLQFHYTIVLKAVMRRAVATPLLTSQTLPFRAPAISPYPESTLALYCMGYLSLEAPRLLPPLLNLFLSMRPALGGSFLLISPFDQRQNASLPRMSL